MSPQTSKKPPTIICVFCGASSGLSPAHLAAARSLAHVFAENNISLVYGGGTNGLMGELAKTLVALSGPESVHGVTPAALIPLEAGRREVEGMILEEPVKKNRSEEGIYKTPSEEIFGKTTVVPDMHKRKRLMADLVEKGGPGSGFIALSGGYGTLEELMEVITWNQLGIHDKGVCVYNVEGYWDEVLTWVGKAVGAGFVQKGNRHILVEGKDGEECVEKLRNYRLTEERFDLEWNDEDAKEKSGSSLSQSSRRSAKI